MRRLLQILLPVVALAIGAGALFLMIALRPEAEPAEQHVPVPVVRTMVVQAETVQITVPTQGTVEPRTEIDLVPQVSGKIVEMSHSLTDGGFFEKDEVLLKIDPRDFQLAITRAAASVAQAEQRLKTEEAEAEIARKEWEALGRGGKPNPLVLREPQLAEARASLAAAEAALEEARLDLERTEILAPFAGRVREESVDIGQFVTTGSRLAQIYSVDYAEVRLPVPDNELAYIDLPLSYRNGASAPPGPEVRLHADFAGKRHVWKGVVVRTDGQIDSRTRQVTLIAQVENPYGRSEKEQPPLAVGMFVQAEILGRKYENVVVLPRSALREAGQVAVVEGEGVIRFRSIDVLRSDRNQVIVRGGLESGEVVCLSILEAMTDGMQVQIDPADDQLKPGPGR